MSLAVVMCVLVPVVIALVAQLAGEPEQISVDVGNVVRETDRRVIGINVDYFMDGGEKLTVGGGLEAALREMGVKCLRYPGGDKSDSYLWSVPPYDGPRPTLAHFSRQKWPRGRLEMVTEDGKTFKRPPLDFDEFMTICQNLGAEPIICCCYDSMHWEKPDDGWAPTREQLLETAVEWVRYANVTRGYGVRYWEIGNESYLGGRHGILAEDYARDYAMFARAMKEVDPTIRVGPNGPNGPEAVGAGDRNAGREVSWWKTVFETACAEVDFLAVHSYPCFAWHNYQTYVNGALPETTVERLREAAQKRGATSAAEITTDLQPFGGAVDGAVEALQRYCSPEDVERIEIALSETNSADWSHLIGDEECWPHINTLGHALVLFDIIGSHLMHASVDMLCVWNTRWIKNDTEQQLWDALGPQNQLWPTGRATAIWGQFVRDNMVQAQGTDRVRAFASHSPATGELSVFLLNKPCEPTTVQVVLNGGAAQASGERWVFTGKEPEDLDPTWTKVGPVEVQDGNLTLDLPGASLTVLALA